MSDDSLPVDKNAFTILVPREMMPGFEPQITDEERARYAAERQARLAMFETARGRWAVLLTDQTQPKVLHDLLVLHAPALQYQSSYHPPMFHDLTFVSCLSCESGEDHHAWPCPTAEVLAEHYGIEVADWYGIPVRDVLPG